MIEIEEKELAQIIRPVGFFNNKAKYIKQTAEIIKKMSNNGLYDIPNNFDDLVALPGVGPKMAYLVMDCAWKK
jgi:endonuclease-3